MVSIIFDCLSYILKIILCITVIQCLFTKKKRNKVFISLHVLKDWTARLAILLFSCTTLSTQRGKHESVNGKMQRKTESEKRSKSTREHRTSRKETTVSSVSPQACDSARNSLHSAYKISETKTRQVRPTGGTTLWDSSIFGLVYRNFVSGKCGGIFMPCVCIRSMYQFYNKYFYPEKQAKKKTRNWF